MKYFNVRRIYYNVVTDEVYICYYYAICVAINFRMFTAFLLNCLADDSS